MAKQGDTECHTTPQQYGVRCKYVHISACLLVVQTAIVYSTEKGTFAHCYCAELPTRSAVLSQLMLKNLPWHKFRQKRVPQLIPSFHHQFIVRLCEVLIRELRLLQL